MDVTSMTVKEMKEELAALGGTAEGCVEKSEIVQRLLEARGLAESKAAAWPQGAGGGGGSEQQTPASPAGSPPKPAPMGPPPPAPTGGEPAHVPQAGGAGGGSATEGIHVAIEGCCHGELDAIYASVLETQKRNGITIDLLLICGDFQACRNEQDLNCMAVPQKYRTMASFYKYYSGECVAPMLTIFVGGNHEASNHLWELFHGGWVAPNIYYLGHAGVVEVGGLRIAGLSGIFKGGDYRQGHWERPPYDNSSMRSAYHVREYDVWKLMQLSGHVDVVLSHDWPRGVHRHGNERRLLQSKRFLEQEVQSNTLGNPHTVPVMKQLKPDYWFAAHLHTKFAALVKHDETSVDGLVARTKFLSLDKCLPNRDFLQVIHFPKAVRETTPSGARLKMSYDMEWLAILRAAEPYRSISRQQPRLPCVYNVMKAHVKEELAWVKGKAADDSAFLEVPDNFEVSLEAHVPGKRLAAVQPPFHASKQTLQFVEKLGIRMPHVPPASPASPAGGTTTPGGAPAGAGAGGFVPDGASLGDGGWGGAAAAANPDEIEIDDDVVSDGEAGETAGGAADAAGNAEEIDIDDE